MLPLNLQTVQAPPPPPFLDNPRYILFFFRELPLLKLVSANFYQILIFSLNDSPLKFMKNVFYFI